MIDAKTEELVTLRDATKLLPKRRGGKRPHVATLYRWALRGLRGVVLETLQIGGTLCTSEEALQRFFERLTVERAPALETEVPSQERIETELERHGL